MQKIIQFATGLSKEPDPSWPILLVGSNRWKKLFCCFRTMRIVNSLLKLDLPDDPAASQSMGSSTSLSG